MSGRVGAIGKQVSDPAILTRASQAQLKLAITLANIIECGKKLKARGAPPTARMVPFLLAVKSACSHYTTGSHLLAKGIGKATPQGHTVAEIKRGTAMIKQAMTELQRGSASLAQAQSRLVTLAS
jgi:hypothetical protein